MRTALALLAAAALAFVACSHVAPAPAVALPPAQAAAPAQPAIDPDAAPLPLWPEVTKGTLPNGLTYYVLKHGKPEKRAMMWLAVNAGSVDEDDDQRGLAHFDEHMAFNGTQRFPKNELIQYLESIGMRFGADLNAYTAWQQTVYQLEVPTDDPKYIAKGFDILRDWAGGVSYDPVEVEKERGVVLEEWRLGRGAGMRVFDKQSKVLFQGSRYADRIPIGLPEIIKTASRDTLARFYRDWYRPDQMAVIVVGEVEPAAIAKTIEERFGDLKNPAHERAHQAAGVPKAGGTRVTIETDKELPATSVAVYNLVPHRPEASANDFRRHLVERVYQTIMNQRLATLRRNPDAPFIVAMTGMNPLVREIDAFTRMAQVKSGKVEESLRAILTEALRAERHGFAQSELDRARAIIQRAEEASATREATEDSRDYTDELTRNFFVQELVTGRAVERDLTLKYLPLITIEELNARVKSFGGAENRVIAIAGPDGQPLPTQERALQIAAEVEKSDIPAWQDKPVPASLMPKRPAAGKIVGEKKLPAIDVTEWTLSNGIRVIVRPTDYERDTVLLSSSGPGGTALASDADYNDARFAASVASLGGAGDFDSDTLGKILAGKHAQVSVGISEVTQGVNANASPRDLETMFQLLHLRLTAPRKDAQQFAIWQATAAEQIANQERSPEYQYAKQSQQALYANHPRRSFPTAADYSKVDIDKALAFYRARFADLSNSTFVIVGELDLEKLRPLVETYLASLPGAGKEKGEEKDLGIRKARGVVKKEMRLGIEPKASVRFEFHGDEGWSRDKERDLYTLSQVLSIRLREILREDMGGVYGVGASGAIARSPHQERSFTISFGCDPARVDDLLKAAHEEISTLEKKGIGADILDKVKQTYLRERETALRTNKFWLARLEQAYRYGDDPLEIPDTSKTAARMTSALVQASAKKYLDPKQTFEAVRLPEEKH